MFHFCANDLKVFHLCVCHNTYNCICKYKHGVRVMNKHPQTFRLCTDRWFKMPYYHTFLLQNGATHYTCIRTFPNNIQCTNDTEMFHLCANDLKIFSILCKYVTTRATLYENINTKLVSYKKYSPKCFIHV